MYQIKGNDSFDKCSEIVCIVLLIVNYDMADIGVL